jgi:hypothetical protein
VAQRERVALPRVDADHVVAELRQHRLRELARRERVGRLLEGGHEPAAAAPPEVAALPPRPGVRRLAPRHVLELRPAGDLGAQARGAVAGRRGVGGRDRARDAQQRDDGAARAHVRGLVRVVVRAQLGVGRADGAVGHEFGTERDETDLRRVVLVLPELPQPRVRRVRLGGHLRQQLLARDLRAVVALEVLQDALRARRRAAEEAAVLVWVEAAVRLQLRVLGQLRRRRRLGELPDLVVGHADVAALDLLLQHDVGHHLVEDGLLDLLALVEGEGAAGALLLLLRARLDGAEPVGGEDVLPVHLRHGRGRRHRLAAQQPGALAEQEDPDEDGGHRDHEILAATSHRLQHSSTPGRGGGGNPRGARGRRGRWHGRASVRRGPGRQAGGTRRRRADVRRRRRRAGRAFKCTGRRALKASPRATSATHAGWPSR